MAEKVVSNAPLNLLWLSTVSISAIQSVTRVEIFAYFKKKILLWEVQQLEGGVGMDGAAVGKAGSQGSLQPGPSCWIKKPGAA